MHFLISAILIAVTTIIIAYVLSHTLLNEAPENCKAWNAPYKMEIITFISILFALVTFNYLVDRNVNVEEYGTIDDFYNSNIFGN